MKRDLSRNFFISLLKGPRSGPGSEGSKGSEGSEGSEGKVSPSAMSMKSALRDLPSRPNSHSEPQAKNLGTRRH